MSETTEANDTAGPRDIELTPEQRRAKLRRLGLIIAAIVVASIVTNTYLTVAVVAALLLMIMLHEFGHFVTAKWADMKVSEFFVGFGPRLWSVRRGETEYGVKAIPVGGYVRILGMHNLDPVDPADEPRTYRQKPYWRRLSVAVAGSAMHMIIAFALLWALHGPVGLPADEPTTAVGSLTKLTTGESPAVDAGFKVGDKIVAADGRPLHKWEQLRSYIMARPGKSITFDVVRKGRDLTLTGVPVDLNKVHVKGIPDEPKSSKPYGFMGIGAYVPVKHAGPIAAIGEAGKDLGDKIVVSGKALFSFFSPSNLHGYTRQLTGQATTSSGTGSASDSGGGSGGNRFLSPVGFVRVASQAAHTGLREVLMLLMLINVFVGLFNLVPLLPLDGGHVAIATYEKIRSLRRKGAAYHADVAKLMPLTYAVVVVLVTIGITALYLDIVRPLSNPFQ